MRRGVLAIVFLLASTWPATPARGLVVEPVAVPLDSSSVSLAWMAPFGTTSVEIRRNGRLLDVVAPSFLVAYVDRGLWPATRYDYTLFARDRRGRLLGVQGVAATTPDRLGPFERLYSAHSFWNLLIGREARPHPRSKAMVREALLRYSSSANFANSDKWGVSVAYSSRSSKWYEVRCRKYDCSTSVAGRVRRLAHPATGSDRHLAVLDLESGRELDMWQATYRRNDSWSASSRYVMNPRGDGACGAPGSRCNSAVASGFALMGGVVRPEEIAQGRIDHALAFTTPMTRAGEIACPATHTDGTVRKPSAIPLGARIQLDPSFEIPFSWPRWKRVIAIALQEYGAFLVDTGGSVAIRGETTLARGYDAWELAGAPRGGGSLADLPWRRFRVLDYERC